MTLYVLFYCCLQIYLDVKCDDASTLYTLISGPLSTDEFMLNLDIQFSILKCYCFIGRMITITRV